MKARQSVSVSLYVYIYIYIYIYIRNPHICLVFSLYLSIRLSLHPSRYLYSITPSRLAEVTQDLCLVSL